VPAAAQSISTFSVSSRAPAPEADVGLISLVLVGAAAFLTYRRRRQHNGP
jgi:hypothetical protein